MDLSTRLAFAFAAMLLLAIAPVIFIIISGSEPQPAGEAGPNAAVGEELEGRGACHSRSRPAPRGASEEVRNPVAR